MDEEEAILAITAFFKTEVFNPKHEIKESEIKNREERDTGPGTRSFSVLTLEDGTEWVLGDRSIQRFLGYLYLKKSIEYHQLVKFRPAEVRYIYKPKIKDRISVRVKTINEGSLKGLRTINSSDFFSVSKYMGDTKPEEQDIPFGEKFILVSEIGFVDIAYGANLRKEGDHIYILDTEYGSFKSEGINGGNGEDGSQKKLAVNFERELH